MPTRHFVNATGWPAEATTRRARDMAILARAIINEDPEHYAIYAQKEFFWNDIKQPNRNLLLWRDTTVDGLKTGHTEEAGYCLVASAKRERPAPDRRGVRHRQRRPARDRNRTSC